MPQMAPMLWIMILIITIFSLINFSYLMFFMLELKKSKFKTKKMSIYKTKW